MHLERKRKKKFPGLGTIEFQSFSSSDVTPSASSLGIGI
jgi:hypothetical protein